MPYKPTTKMKREKIKSFMPYKPTTKKKREKIIDQHTGKARSSKAVWLKPNFVNRRPPGWDWKNVIQLDETTYNSIDCTV